MLLCILLCTVHLRILNVSPCQLLVNILWIRIFDTTCIFCFNYTNFNLWGYYLKYLCMVIYLYFRWNVWCAAINGSIQFRNAHESRCNGMCLMQWATDCLTFFCNKLRFSLNFFWLMNLYHIKMCYLFFLKYIHEVVLHDFIVLNVAQMATFSSNSNFHSEIFYRV